MQILLSTQNLQAAVLLFIADRFNLAEDESIQVDLTDEGAIVTVIAPGEEETAAPAAGTTPSSSTQSSKPATTRKPRRTKAQIEADEAEARAAEEAAKAAAEEEQGKGSTQIDSASSAATSDTASSSVAGGETESSVSPQPEQSAEPAVVVAEESDTPEPVNPVEEQPQEEAPAPKPTASLFANLRKPVNS